MEYRGCRLNGLKIKFSRVLKYGFYGIDKKPKLNSIHEAIKYSVIHLKNHM